MASRYRLLLAAAALALALGTLPMWCSRNPAPSVETAAAQRAPLRVLVSTNGTIEPISDTEIRARLDGRVLAIPDPGKDVQAGEVILRLDDASVAAELATAESDRLAAKESLRAARAAAAQARERFAIEEKLFAQRALTREAFLASQAALREAEAQVTFLEQEVPLRVASLDARIQELQAQREAAIVRAPFSGTVYKTQVKAGAAVRVGDPLLWLADLGQLRVRANVDQVDLGRVQVDQRVLVSANAFPGRSWTGRITELVPHVVVKENRSVAEGLARLDRPTDGLVPGMTVDVQIVVAEAENALQVPAEALFNPSAQAYVYRVEDGRVYETPVKTGLSSITAVQITDGLREGDVVVLGPAPGLHDGMRVEVARQNGAHLRGRAVGTAADVIGRSGSGGDESELGGTWAATR